MEITRKIFYNKRNGQGSITLPSKTLRELEKEMKLDKPLKKISLKITSPNGLKDSKVKIG